MFHTLRISATVCIVALMVSCGKKSPEKGPQSPYGGEATLFASIEGFTRSYIGANKSVWYSGDSFGYYDDATQHTENGRFTLTEGGGETSALFKGELATASPAEGRNIYAIYPYNAGIPAPTGYTLVLPAPQQQRGATDPGGGGKYCFMVAEPITTDIAPGAGLVLKFHQIMSVADIAVRNIPSGSSVTKVVLRSSDGSAVFTSQATLNLTLPATDAKFAQPSVRSKVAALTVMTASVSSDFTASIVMFPIDFSAVPTNLVAEVVIKESDGSDKLFRLPLGGFDRHLARGKRIDLTFDFADPSVIEGSAAGSKFDSYDGLVMVGYQMWFNCPGDGSEAYNGGSTSNNLNWKHYGIDVPGTPAPNWTPKQTSGRFNYGGCMVAMWPDVSEYEKTYETSFKLPNGQNAYVFSSWDEQTIDTQIRWMRDYDIDGFFLQRFTNQFAGSNPIRKAITTRNIEQAKRLAEKYQRAWAVMYDISKDDPGPGETLVTRIKADIDKLVLELRILESPTYLKHRGKPLIAMWGVGRPEANQNYTLAQIEEIVDYLKDESTYGGFSVMAGTPWCFRSQSCSIDKTTDFHRVLRKFDVVHGWYTGHFSASEFSSSGFQSIRDDIDWCKTNGISYAATISPGFSWQNRVDSGNSGNSEYNVDAYRRYPRANGMFFWNQVSKFIDAGGKSIYITMFDEVDEGTAIFKCTTAANTPVEGYGQDNGVLTKFLAFEDGEPNDHYLWLAGQAGKMLRGEIPFTTSLPPRN